MLLTSACEYPADSALPLPSFAGKRRMIFLGPIQYWNLIWRNGTISLVFFTYNNWLLMRSVCAGEKMEFIPVAWVSYSKAEFYGIFFFFSELWASWQDPVPSMAAQNYQSLWAVWNPSFPEASENSHCPLLWSLRLTPHFPSFDHFSFLLLSFPFGLSNVQLCTTCFFQLDTPNSGLLLFKYAALSCSYAQVY